MISSPKQHQTMPARILLILATASVSAICTVLTLWLKIPSYLAYFLLYFALTIYILENWAFNKELAERDDDFGSVKTLLDRIETLSQKVQILEKILAFRANVLNKDRLNKSCASF